MAEFEEDGVDVVAVAAKILLSLRDRELQRWPEWVPWPSKDPASAVLPRWSEEPVVEEEEDEAEWELPPVPVGWPKRPRSPRHVEARATAWSLSLEDLLARMRYSGSAGSGGSSRREDAARLRSRSREKPRVKAESMAAAGPEMPPCHVAPSGSGPSTSGVDRLRSRTVKAPAKVAAQKESMAASSPETPLDYATAVGSGASSSGEYDGARSSTAKRKATGAASGSGGASSCDEGSSSPAKRARPDPDAAAPNVQEAKPEEEEKYRDEKGHLLFDLNEDLAPWQD